MTKKEPKAGDRVYCIIGPKDDDMLGTVISTTEFGRAHVRFDDGDDVWCKLEWIECIEYRET